MPKDAKETNLKPKVEVLLESATFMPRYSETAGRALRSRHNTPQPAAPQSTPELTAKKPERVPTPLPEDAALERKKAYKHIPI